MRVDSLLYILQRVKKRWRNCTQRVCIWVRSCSCAWCAATGTNRSPRSPDMCPLCTLTAHPLTNAPCAGKAHQKYTFIWANILFYTHIYTLYSYLIFFYYPIALPVISFFYSAHLNAVLSLMLVEGNWVGNPKWTMVRFRTNYFLQTSEDTS